MNDGKQTWLAVLDGRGGRLLVQRNTGGARGRPRLDLVASTGNPWRELDGDGGGLPVQRHAGDRRSELLARYAVDLVKWLAELVKKNGIEQLEVFVPPRLQGLLQSLYAQSLSLRITYHRGDLGGLDPAELERDPDVQRVLADARGGRPRRAS